MTSAVSNKAISRKEQTCQKIIFYWKKYENETIN